MNPRITLVVFATVLVCMICLLTAKIYIFGFDLGNHQARGVWVAAILIPILYIGSFFNSRNANRLGKIYYRTINIVAGIVFYLFLGAILLGFISIPFAFSGTMIPLDTVWAIFGLALLSAAAGFIQARRIVVKQYEVTLSQAPDSWNGKTAAMISDTHFGLINHKKFADKVVNKLLSLKPDFALHAGDFYDGPIVDTESITASWKRLTAEIPLFYTPGNHEAYGDYRLFIDSVKAAGATVLENEKTEYDGIQIAGTLYHPGKEPHDIGDTLKSLSLDKEMATILINHPPTAFAAPDEYGVNLIVSGHTHRGQTWPFRYLTKKVYAGYDYGVKPYKNLISITSNGIGTYGPPIRLFNSPEVVLITFKV
ncbi:MAG: hypothetical protein JWL92_161 [Candidatus Nomurabacteria bacterium]|nr:hypothetical protein [Candidatus Nomurabacteria bacterium]